MSLFSNFLSLSLREDYDDPFQTCQNLIPREEAGWQIAVFPRKSRRCVDFFTPESLLAVIPLRRWFRFLCLVMCDSDIHTSPAV